eukprot:TRINITY_DN88476_c0_g1_i1.p1 TRINITY_DN88476_c0_g1~~TRINITY_DN88476_c0_g1_i1.p1  ORF type:complete len:305 (-),score=62.00 TRINITY_DN88476_c0_g1_i1:30-944(-)
MPHSSFFLSYTDHSAANDSTHHFQSGLQGLVSANTTSGFMTLASAQATKMRKIVQVASIRALEALNVVNYLQDAEAEGADSTPGCQIAGGEGFGSADGATEDDGDGDALGGLGGLASMGKGGKKGEAAALGSALGGGDSGSANIDYKACMIAKALGQTVGFAQKAVYDAAYLEKVVSGASKKSNMLVGATAELLNLPGFPPDGLPPGYSLRKPLPELQPQERPTDVPPAFLDFVYTTKEGYRAPDILPGLDPYRLPGPKPEGREVHNFFGSPPLPEPKAEIKYKQGSAQSPGASGLASLSKKLL